MPSPEGGSIYDGWKKEAGKASAAHNDVALDNLGGGSDFAPFYNHLGIPSAGWGFGGGSGEYHSAYDTYAFESRFADPGFTHHAASAQLLAVAAMRLADADVLPYDYAEAARELRASAHRLRDEVVAAPRAGTPAALAALDRLDAAFASMERAADSLAVARDALLGARGATAGVTAEQPPATRGRIAARAKAANRHLLQVERSLLRQSGLRSRPWMRNLTVAADYRNGYANQMLPGIAEALRANDPVLVAAEADDLARRLDVATVHLREAAGELRR